MILTGYVIIALLVLIPLGRLLVAEMDPEDGFERAMVAFFALCFAAFWPLSLLVALVHRAIFRPEAPRD